MTLNELSSMFALALIAAVVGALVVNWFIAPDPYEENEDDKENMK